MSESLLSDRCILCAAPRDDVGSLCASCRRDNIEIKPYRPDWLERILAAIAARMMGAR